MKRTSDVLLKELNERSEQMLDVSLPASSDSALSHLRLADSLYRNINTIRLSHLRLADTLCQGSYKQFEVRFKNSKDIWGSVRTQLSTDTFPIIGLFGMVFIY